AIVLARLCRPPTGGSWPGCLTGTSLWPNARRRGAASEDGQFASDEDGRAVVDMLIRIHGRPTFVPRGLVRHGSAASGQSTALSGQRQPAMIQAGEIASVIYEVGQLQT